MSLRKIEERDIVPGMVIRATNMAGVTVQGRVHHLQGDEILYGSGGVFTTYHNGWTYEEVIDDDNS